MRLRARCYPNIALADLQARNSMETHSKLRDSQAAPETAWCCKQRSLWTESSAWAHLGGTNGSTLFATHSRSSKLKPHFQINCQLRVRQQTWRQYGAHGSAASDTLQPRSPSLSRWFSCQQFQTSLSSKVSNEQRIKTMIDTYRHYLPHFRCFKLIAA